MVTENIWSTGMLCSCTQGRSCCLLHPDLGQWFWLLCGCSQELQARLRSSCSISGVPHSSLACPSSDRTEMSPGEDRQLLSHRAGDLVQVSFGFLLSTICSPVLIWHCDKPFINFDIFPSTWKKIFNVLFKEFLKRLSWAFTGNFLSSWKISPWLGWKQ